MVGSSVWTCAFDSQRDFQKGKLRVRPARGSGFSRYRVMVNYWGVRSLANSSIVLAREATKSLSLRNNPPPIVPTLSLYVIRIISLVSLLPYLFGLKWILGWKKNLTHCLSFVRSSLACNLWRWGAWKCNWGDVHSLLKN